MTTKRSILSLPCVCFQCRNLCVDGKNASCDKRRDWPGVWSIRCEEKERLYGGGDADKV